MIFSSVHAYFIEIFIIKLYADFKDILRMPRFFGILHSPVDSFFKYFLIFKESPQKSVN